MKVAWLSIAFAVASTMSMAVHADQPQSLTAQVAGKVFTSDDDGILLVPVQGSFTLQAATAGAASWPPPKTPIDRLSISCDADSLAKPLKLTAREFQDSDCRASFEVGVAAGSSESPVKYELDKSSSDTLFEITAVRGKVIEGRFRFTMKSEAGATLAISDGRFVAEDRQL